MCTADTFPYSWLLFINRSSSVYLLSSRGSHFFAFLFPLDTIWTLQVCFGPVFILSFSVSKIMQRMLKWNNAVEIAPLHI